MSLFIKNPHSVLAALETRPKDVIEVVIAPKETSDLWKQIHEQASKLKIPVSAHPKREGVGKSFKGKSAVRLDESSRMSGTGATIREKQSLPVEELFKLGRSGGDTKHPLWIALDSLQDPQNVGAIFRSAAFFGIQGILMTQERSAPLTAAVYDIASGGVESVPFSIQANLQRSFEVAKEAGLWILGTSEHSRDSYRSVQRDRPWLIVLGNEEKGMRRLTEESCDVLCGVPAVGQVRSLNVSVAAGIILSYFIS